MNSAAVEEMARPRVRGRRRGWIGLAIMACLLLVALLGPLLAPYDPLEQHLLDRRQPPTPAHPFGLDEVGRDLLSRVLHGARLSLAVGLGAVLLAAGAGGLLGALAGLRGGWLDSLAMSGVDLMLAFPTLLLALVLIVVVGPGLIQATVAVGVAAVPTYARLVRVVLLQAKGQEYVLAARACGVGRGRLLWRHLLPACWAPLRVQAALGFGTAILEVAGLSFLGLGAQPPSPEWGAMLGQGRGAVIAAPHVVLFPGLALMVTVLGCNLLADSLQERRLPR